MTRRGDEIPRPRPWSVLARDRKAALGWQHLLSQCPENVDRAWLAITIDRRAVGDRQGRLNSDVGLVKIEGVTLEQWQYKVTGGGRIWYAIDDDRRTLWITRAGVGRPKQTDA